MEEHGTADEQQLRAFRAAKDEFMLDSPQSPLTVAQQKDFHGLVYFPFNPSLHIACSIDEDVSADIIMMDTSTGAKKEYTRLGKITFTVEETSVILTIFQGIEGDLFLPVRDATSGEETYGAGRYLEPELLEDGRVLVDFNYLYNPYCAYNERWSCPLPPRENWLSVPLTAGEKSFHD